MAFDRDQRRADKAPPAPVRPKPRAGVVEHCDGDDDPGREPRVTVPIAPEELEPLVAATSSFPVLSAKTPSGDQPAVGGPPAFDEAWAAVARAAESDLPLLEELYEMGEAAEDADDLASPEEFATHGSISEALTSVTSEVRALGRSGGDRRGAGAVLGGDLEGEDLWGEKTFTGARDRAAIKATRDALPRVERVGVDDPSVGSAARGSIEKLLAAARQLQRQGDLDGALRLLHQAASQEAGNPQVQVLLAQIEQARVLRAEGELGDLDRIPVVRVPAHQITWHKLDHQAGFLLSRIDGLLTYNEIIMVSGMSRADAVRKLAQLVGLKLIEPQR